MDSFKFPLSTALRSNAVFTSATDIVDKLQLVGSQMIVFQKLLEGTPSQHGDLLHWKRELYLEGRHYQSDSFLQVLKSIRK